MKAWQAIKGASKYAKSIATGDVASDEEQRRRLEVCGQCKTRQRRRKHSGYRTLWCGEPFVPEPGVNCGCLLAATHENAAVRVTVDGQELEPAGKLVVGSERCPAGRW
ncbi:MAG: hypothetical protein JSS51_04390 [Planctomycetes bacterium]|nr:hypothetical protein [Planctomycetota bacterium]